MTIPIQTPQIGTTGIVKPYNVLDEIAPYLQALAQQQSAQASMANVRNLAEERRAKAAQEARDLADKAAAAEAFYHHLSGAGTTIKPVQPDKDGVMPHDGHNTSTGELIPLPQLMRGLSPGALEHYGQLVRDYNTTVQQTHEATRTQAASELATAQAAALGDQAARQQAARDILTRYGPKVANPGVRARALTEIGATAGPEIGNQVATMFNNAFPDGPYTHFLGPDGFAYKQNSATGAITQAQFVGQKAPSNELRLEAIRRNAAVLDDLLRAQHDIVAQGLGGSKNPTLAQVAQASRVLGISTEAFANVLRDDPQQATQMLKTRFAHNFVGLLPNSRSAANLLTNLAESYWAPGGSGDALLRRADKDREHLRAMMHAVATGQVSDLSKLGPDFAAAMAAWAADQTNAPPPAGANPNAPPPNPQDWQQGVPPQP